MDKPKQATARSSSHHHVVLFALLASLASLTTPGVALAQDATEEHSFEEPAESMTPRLGVGFALGSANPGLAGGFYAELGVQLTSEHGLSLRGFYGGASNICISLVLNGPDCVSDSTSFGRVSAMYSYNPVHWFELQGGMGLDYTERIGTSVNTYSRLRPAVDVRIAFLPGGRGPGVRAAFDIGIGGHVTSDGDFSVMWTFGFKLH